MESLAGKAFVGCGSCAILYYKPGRLSIHLLQNVGEPNLEVLVDLAGLDWTWVELGGLSVVFGRQKFTGSSVTFHLVQPIRALADGVVFAFLQPISSALPVFDFDF
jgi:hypothetical protein